MRLYRTNCALSSDDGLCVEMRISGGGHVAVAAGRDVAEALDDLQREWWRIERLEARHTLSLDAMLPQVLADPSSNPEEMLARRYESKALACAVATLSPVQMRRLLMHDVALLPIREIAEGGVLRKGDKVRPLTKRVGRWMPTHVLLPAAVGLRRTSTVMLEQVRTIDKARLGARLGIAGEREMARVDAAIAVSPGLVPRRNVVPLCDVCARRFRDAGY
ncbi:MAG: type II toxin-antitoxin system PemK/MazF family toxin [Collinsella aerofaciens]|nr:type II toxin-antitoxin system PemK/MazF family toxin [Collinsella aerofaciens]